MYMYYVINILYLLKWFSIIKGKDKEDSIGVSKGNGNHGGKIIGEGSTCVFDVQGELCRPHLELATVHLLDSCLVSKIYILTSKIVKLNF